MRKFVIQVIRTDMPEMKARTHSTPNPLKVEVYLDMLLNKVTYNSLFSVLIIVALRARLGLSEWP
jgi:hypothetical protein